jgi:nucleoid DNA-binding protein
MTKSDIVDLISKGTGLTKVETLAVVEGFFSTIEYALSKGDHVELRGFGTFCLRERQEKHVLNPKTGKIMHIPHRIMPDFKPSAQLKAHVGRRSESTKASAPEQPETAGQIDLLSEMDKLIVEREELLHPEREKDI